MRKRGFSLIELVVSMSLILFFLTGVAQLIVLSCAAKKKAEFHFAGASLACLKLEYLKSLSFDSAELDPGLHAESVREDNAAEIFRREWKVINIGENMKKVILKISSLPNPKKEATFILLICRELEF